ncbi:MAG: dUTP diphosphatase [Nitriliruptoraceae bacterium]
MSGPGGGVGAGRGEPVPGGADRVRLEVRRLRADAVLPAYAHPGDAGLDLAAVEPARLWPGERVAVATGLALHIPDGWVGLVHPRSGLARRQGLTVANAPGTIDAGYRGEVQVLLVNLGAEVVDIEAGDRIAQLLLQRVGWAEVVEVEGLPGSVRGDGGFGSTGVAGRR